MDSDTNQQVHEQVDAAGQPDDPALKKARRNCIIMLALCGVVAFSFGAAPVTTWDDGGISGFNFNLVSLLGLAGGVFAAGYLALRMRVVLRLSIPIRAAGLLAGAFLIVHSVVAISAPRSVGTGGQGVGGDTAIDRSGPHRWQVAGRARDIEGTYYLPMADGLQYTIVYLLAGARGLAQMHPDRALATAWPLMKHAYENGLHKHAKPATLGRGEMAVSRIGVVLLHHDGKRVRGIRAAMTLDEIKTRIGRGDSAERQGATSGPGG